MKLKFPILLSFLVLFSLTLPNPVLGSTVTVNTEQDLIDTPECTLREAIQAVNIGGAIAGCEPSDAGVPDTVILPAGNYVLSIPGTAENDNADGELDVYANLTLNGAGSGTTAISASGLQPNTPERVLHLNAQDDLLTFVINGVTITEGSEDGDGGGIRINDPAIEAEFIALEAVKAGIPGTANNATLNDVVVINNETEEFGGGIYSEETVLTLNNCQVTGNRAPFGSGGGIGSSSNFCFNCQFLKNLIIGSDTSLTIQNTTISGNTSGQDGGGIYHEALLTMDSSTVSGNTAEGFGGGGIFSDLGTALITNSTISGNQATGTNIRRIQFPDLKLGIFGDGGFGGGIFEVFSELVMVNSTVSGNTAQNSGGGVMFLVDSLIVEPFLKLGAEGSPDLSLFNVTIANNTAITTVGGGIAVFIQDPDTLKLGSFGFQSMVANTIIADNQADDTGEDCFGNFTSLGYNLVEVEEESCAGFTQTGDQLGVDPLLGPLQENGGPTQTQSLLLGSTAIDRANPDGCLDEDGLPLTRDQRNFIRPVNMTGLPTAICDIGAVEVGGAVLEVLKTDSTEGGSVSVGSNFDYTITITNQGPNVAADVQLSDPLPDQVSFVGPITTSQGTCSNAGDTINCDLDDIAVDATVTVSFTVTAVAASSTVVNTVTVTTSTKDFDNGGVYTSTVTTVVGGTGLLEGAGCGFQLVPGPVAAPLAMLGPLALGLGLWLRSRVRRR